MHNFRHKDRRFIDSEAQQKIVKKLEQAKCTSAASKGAAETGQKSIQAYFAPKLQEKQETQQQEVWQKREFFHPNNPKFPILQII